ncbi:hypothetical protein Ciccas_012566 [Cichlidogyrus casuarinus]|uniref:Uncharacterized protein n=1 Tax=Cichlidogyrus casuarinus TaxID=1844966 RepID=A0ABD2PN15_9PLAT
MTMKSCFLLLLVAIAIAAVDAHPHDHALKGQEHPDTDDMEDELEELKAEDEEEVKVADELMHDLEKRD